MAGIVRHGNNRLIEIRPQEDSVWICNCGSSKNMPFCDGSHEQCSGETEGKAYMYEDGIRREVDVPGTPKAIQALSKGFAKSEVVVMTNDTNHYGTIFGGTLLSHMDRTSFIAASKYAGNDVVTVSIENMVFRAPIKLGEIAEIVAHVVAVGKTSLEVCVNVTSGNKKVVENAYFTFVSVDKKGRPLPVPRPSFATKEEKVAYEAREKEMEVDEGQDRKRVRKRLSGSRR